MEEYIFLLEISFNGSASNFFRPTRGLWKGLPLAPLLLLIIVEGLNKTIMEEKRFGTLKSIKIGRSFYLCNFLFVDNVFLLCDGSERDANKKMTS